MSPKISELAKNGMRLARDPHVLARDRNVPGVLQKIFCKIFVPAKKGTRPPTRGQKFVRKIFAPAKDTRTVRAWHTTIIKN
jgi:hypothetical protein